MSKKHLCCNLFALIVLANSWDSAWTHEESERDGRNV